VRCVGQDPEAGDTTQEPPQSATAALEFSREPLAQLAEHLTF